MKNSNNKKYKTIGLSHSSLHEYQKTLSCPLSLRTVTFLLRNDEVLLGLKLRGFGKGNYLGIGGKVEESKDRHAKNQDFLTFVKNGARREIFEEIGVGVKPEDLETKGTVSFYFPDESWNQEVYIFVVKKWQGEPKSVHDDNAEIEIQPEWCKVSNIPFHRMWDDAKYWLPDVLNGKNINASFLFDKNLHVIDHTK